MAQFHEEESIRSALFQPLEKDLGLIPKDPDKNVEGEGGQAAEDDMVVNAELALYSVACQMNVVGGEFGFHPGVANSTSEAYRGQGSVFWFSIPYSLDTEKGPAESNPAKVEPKVTEPATGAPTRADASEFQKAVSAAMGEGHGKPVAKNATVARRKRALVVEDSRVVRKMLTNFFTKLGYVVTGAENGLDGMVEMKASLYDVVLCDFLMPGMDGIDCIKQYRDWETNHRQWQKQWIVGISAHASETDVEKGIEVGMSDFLPKPITFAALSNLMNSDAQIAISKRLDDIEAGDNNLASGNDGGQSVGALDSSHRETKRRKMSPSAELKGQVMACLILSPPNSHIGMVQETLKSHKWQSTLGQTEKESRDLLQMRKWDLILVDDSFRHLIVDFRKWEAKRRKEKTRENNDKG